MPNKYVDLTAITRFKANADDAYVAKVTGKQLSTEDYTTTEKTKLAGLENTVIIDSLTSTDAGKAMSAKQGKTLKDQIDAIDLEITNLGAGDMLASVYDADDDGVVDQAAKLASAKSIAATGDATWSVSFDGSANASSALTLANTGVTAGTYTKITVDAKGRATAGAQEITLADISDVGTAAAKDVGTAAGNVPIIGVSGKLDTSVLPDLPDGHDTFTVASASGLTGLTTAGLGNTDITQDTGDAYVLVALPATTAANWKKHTNGSDGVTSWAGRTGAVVPTTAEVTESTNLYYTDARVTARIAATASSALTDGATLLHAADMVAITVAEIDTLF
jgi:hypothetical protein